MENKKMNNLLFPLTTSVLTEKISHETAQFRPADLLVSFLYFAAVLALIYLALTLVSKLGKKDQNADSPSNPIAPEKNGETDKLNSPEKKGETDKLNTPEKSGETNNSNAPKKEKGGSDGE